MKEGLALEPEVLPAAGPTSGIEQGPSQNSQQWGRGWGGLTRGSVDRRGTDVNV